MPAPNPVNVFFCYAPADEELRSELEKHLSLLKRQGFVRSWSARVIGGGEEWRGAIDRHLDEADAILLLISTDFLASDYLYDVELARALERRRTDGTQVIAILLRPGDYAFAGSPLKEEGLAVLPQNGVPVTSWPSRDAAFADVSQGLRLLLRGDGYAGDGRAVNPSVAHPPQASGGWARARRPAKDRSPRCPRSGTSRTAATRRSRAATRSSTTSTRA